jgi:hypothetical protein
MPWNTLARRLAAFEQIAARVRRFNDALLELRARLAAYRAAASIVSSERRHLEQHVAAILGVLHDFRSRGSREQREPYLTAKDASAVWADLWRIGNSGAEQRKILLSAVEYVTVEGLSEIVGANPRRIDAVAAKIAWEAPPGQGPGWGGQPCKDSAHVLFVLPPVAPGVQEKLRQLMENYQAEATVAFADTAIAGANVLKYSLRKINSVKELFPGVLRRHLAEGASSDAALLIHPEGTKHLGDMGISVVDGEAIFDDDDMEDDHAA